MDPQLHHGHPRDRQYPVTPLPERTTAPRWISAVLVLVTGAAAVIVVRQRKAP